MAKKKGKGALATSPSNANKPSTTNPADLQREYKALQGKSDAQSQARRRQLVGLIRDARRQAPAQGQTPPPIDPYAAPMGDISTGLRGQLGYASEQGAFRPQDFAGQQQQAFQAVMNQFEQANAPQFAREQRDFQQMAAERGLDPNSEVYRSLQQQLNQRQDQARQNALSQAQLMATDVGKTAYEQQQSTYLTPFKAMESFAPFYGQMGETSRLGQAQTFEGGQAQLTRDWQARQNELDRAANMAMARQGRGGGLSYEQQLGLIDRQQANAAALEMARGGGGAPPRQPGFLENAGVAFVGQLPNAIMGRRS